jgi:signal transduction histidine kinase
MSSVPPPTLDRRASRWLAGFAVWTLLGALSTVQTILTLRQRGERVDVYWVGITIEQMASWYICALFTPAYFALVRRFPLERGRRARNAVVHLAAVLASALVKIPLEVAVLDAAGLLRRGVDVRDALERNYISAVVGFGVMLAVVYGVEMHWRARERELQAARLREQLTGARLELLTATLQPHFLFNSLQAVSTLMHRDVAAADAMIGGLSDLLRRSISDGAAEVTVTEEMELVRCYLSIMQVRFGDRLTSGIRVEPGAEEAMVPRLILQPLVENAIRHGVARRPGAGRVTVAASVEGGRLCLRVADDGPGGAHDGGGFEREGTGLSNTRLRLREMFGDDHALRVANGEGNGLEVRLELPLRRASVAEAV